MKDYGFDICGYACTLKATMVRKPILENMPDFCKKIPLSKRIRKCQVQ